MPIFILLDKPIAFLTKNQTLFTKNITNIGGYYKKSYNFANAPTTPGCPFGAEWRKRGRGNYILKVFAERFVFGCFERRKFNLTKQKHCRGRCCG